MHVAVDLSRCRGGKLRDLRAHRGSRQQEQPSRDENSRTARDATGREHDSPPPHDTRGAQNAPRAVAMALASNHRSATALKPPNRRASGRGGPLTARTFTETDLCVGSDEGGLSDAGTISKLCELGRSDPGDLLERINGGKRSVLVAKRHDGTGQGGPDAR